MAGVNQTIQTVSYIVRDLMWRETIAHWHYKNSLAKEKYQPKEYAEMECIIFQTACSIALP